MTTKKNKRCQHPNCNKKLGLISFHCSCGKDFCIKHQQRHAHNCIFDTKKQLREKIIKDNPKINSKIIKI